jgi:TonB-dependent starch-binding outer membrane protein SusC
MKKFLQVLVSLSLLFFATTTHAQYVNVSGVVTSAEDQLPLVGVSVVVKGTTKGTITDIDGKYSLSAPEKGTLVFSFVGFAAYEEALGGKNTIDVVLKVGADVLNEVVVTGFGSQIKRELTGNIARLKSKDIENMPVVSVDQALQGKAAGVYVNAGGGKLGQAVTVRIRGNSSISASSQPLYIVDGTPVTTGDLGNYGGETNPLSDINPNDIESIEILKDASAGAIYGARAANGVVLITTKRGKSGKTSVTANFQTGTSQATKRVPFLNAAEYEKFYRQAAGYLDKLNGVDPKDPSSDTQYLFGQNGFISEQSLGTYGTPQQVDSDWQEKIFRKAPMSQADVQISGGTDRTKFFISGQFLDQKGTLIGNELKRISTRLNLDHKATNWLDLGLTMSLSRTDNRRLPDDNAFSNPLQAVALMPHTPFIDPNTGLPVGAPPGDANLPLYYNPILSIDYGKYTATVYRNLANAYGQVNFTPNFLFRTEIGMDILTQNEDGYFKSQTVRNQTRAVNGVGENRSAFVTNYNTNNYFNYNNTFDIHRLDFTVGMSYQQSQNLTNYTEGTNFASNFYTKLTSAATKTDGSSTQTDFRFLSYFARANYKLMDKYILAASARIDGSSRFGANARYSFFPSVSVGWILTEEDFLKNFKALSFLKLRGSYGGTGNAELGNFPQLSLATSDAGYVGAPGQRPSQIVNPDLKWETTYQADIGLDFGLFDNRVTGEIDYYVKNTKDLLLDVNVPAPTGFLRQARNIGSLENKGFELVLNTQNFVGDFKWMTSFNIATNTNKVTDIDGQIVEGGIRNMNRVVEGQPIGVFFTPEYAGVDPKNGDALWYRNSKKADGTIDRSTVSNDDYNLAERVVVGNPSPKFIGGITNTFSYKGIDLSIFFNGVYGNKINFYGVGQYSSANGIYEDNQTKDQLNAWRSDNTNTDIPEARYLISNGNQPSSRYIYDGSYLRLRTLSIGYNLPKSVISKMRLEKLRVYLSGQNLATFTKYKGWDPEVNSDSFTTNFAQGNDFYTPPMPRVLLFGINVGF